MITKKMKKARTFQKPAVITSVLSLASLGFVAPAIASNATFSPNNTTASTAVAATSNKQEAQFHGECKEVHVHTYVRPERDLSIRQGPVLSPGSKVDVSPAPGPWFEIVSPFRHRGGYIHADAVASCGVNPMGEY